ncbi:tissue factor-like [Mugil cephalus]|uniref:tissue factor-like n=1 Tax=Mugil cephalus TaxID=48193 RepID=UPI001FB808C2|nr:tissue factor-like [Mugil cephalus]
MASVKILLHLGICLSAWSIIVADENLVPKADNVKWVSLDFKTILTWTAKPSGHTYSVLYSMEGDDWTESPDCSRLLDFQCDLTSHLEPLDRIFSADVQTEPADSDYNHGGEDLPHTYSSPFNPYKESNISAVEFTVEAVDERKVIVNITDPLTSIHRRGKQLSIRDILKNDLKYKISYSKSGSTGKKDVTSDNSIAEVSELDAGESYCFMVAAFIPSRPKATQQGAWSKQLCAFVNGGTLKGLSHGVWTGIVFILITVLIIILIVAVLCCRRQRNKSLQIPQSSVAI